MTTPKKTAAPKRKPNKQKEVTAESFVRMAKNVRERSDAAMIPTADGNWRVSTPSSSILKVIADIFEAEAKRLRAMR